MTLETQDTFSISLIMASFTRLDVHCIYNSFLFIYFKYEVQSSQYDHGDATSNINWFLPDEIENQADKDILKVSFIKVK